MFRHRPRYARIGSGARRAMWRELERMFTGTVEAQIRRVQIEAEWAQAIPYDETHFPRISPEPFDIELPLTPSIP